LNVARVSRMIDATEIERKARIVYYGIPCHMVSTVAVDSYVLDSLMPDLVGHDRQPSAFLVYLFLWRLAHGSGAATTQVPLRDIAEGSGLSKRAVQGALGWLVKRRLIGVARASITAVPVYTVLRPWRR
jgi:hypothetical protein